MADDVRYSIPQPMGYFHPRDGDSVPLFDQEGRRISLLCHADGSVTWQIVGRYGEAVEPELNDGAACVDYGHHGREKCVVCGTEVLFARCHDECVRLLAENELLRAALLSAHEEEEVCFCYVLDNQHCLVRLSDGSDDAHPER